MKLSDRLSQGAPLQYTSLAELIIQAHLSVQGAYTSPWFPAAFWPITAVATQGPFPFFLRADDSDAIIYGIKGLVSRTTAGTYPGRWVEVDSRGILDLSLIGAPGAEYRQFDGRVYIPKDPNGKNITNTTEGIATAFLRPELGPWFFLDPFYLEKGQSIQFNLDVLHNPGVAQTVVMLFMGTYLYGGEAAAR